MHNNYFKLTLTAIKIIEGNSHKCAMAQGIVAC